MTVFHEALVAEVIADPSFIEQRRLLFKAYIHLQCGEEYEAPEASTVAALSDAAQILRESENEEHSYIGNMILTMLLDVFGGAVPELSVVANFAFSNSGDFPNLRLLAEKFRDTTTEFDLLDEVDFRLHETVNTVLELGYPLTDYQRLLWKELRSGEDLITVAPTSAGKTHIILSYLVLEMAKRDEAFAVVIVPTRALISEVSTKIFELRHELDVAADISVRTVSKEDEYQDRTIFVMTQERLHEVLQHDTLEFDFLFVDEAQNIADKERGVLLHLTIETLLENSVPQIILSMPSASYKEAFVKLFSDTRLVDRSTDRSPVAKIITGIEYSGRNLSLTQVNGLTEREGSPEHIIPKGFTGNETAELVRRLAVGQSSIIYQNTKPQCEKLAVKLVDTGEAAIQSDILDTAADFVAKFIHQDFSLVKTLPSGVAFHYGTLPSSVRILVERLVRSGDISHVVCTSTLAQGVNLPAKNLFLSNPYIRGFYGAPHKPLEKVALKNITGRAGRMGHHFSGNVFLIEPSKWRYPDSLDDSESEVKIPSFYQALNDRYSDVLDLLNDVDPSADTDLPLLVNVVNKLLKDQASGKLSATLDNYHLLLEENQTKELTETVSRAVKGLRVPSTVLDESPTIGYFQQDRLFRFFETEEGLIDWKIPHPQSTDLYPSLVKAAELLTVYGIFSPGDNFTIPQVCNIASKWVKGQQLSAIISGQVGTSSDIDVNKVVRNTIEMIDTFIRFRLANALKCFDLVASTVALARGLEWESVKLPAYLEVGASDDVVYTLINLGLSREAAIEVRAKRSSSGSLVSRKDIASALDSDELRSIHPVIRQELKALLGR